MNSLTWGTQRMDELAARAKAIHQELQLTLDQLPEWVLVYGACFQCGRLAQIPRPTLVRAIGKNGKLRPAEARLRCKGCGNRRYNNFAMGKAPR